MESLTVGLPELTALQFAIMGILMGGEESGQKIRDALAKQKIKKDGPAFYQLMARLEDARHVTGRYDQKIIDGQIIKQRRYELTAQGARAWQSTAHYYLTQSQRVQGGLAHA